MTRCTWAPERLRAIIGHTLAAGTFVVCHDTLTYGAFPDYGPAICRGFFSAYAGRSPALILLPAFQRLVEVPRRTPQPGPEIDASRSPRRMKPATASMAHPAHHVRDRGPGSRGRGAPGGSPLDWPTGALGPGKPPAGGDEAEHLADCPVQAGQVQGTPGHFHARLPPGGTPLMDRPR